MGGHNDDLERWFMKRSWLKRATPVSRWAVAFLCGMTLALFILGSASAETIWLDQPLKPWNVAGAAIPTAPPAQLAQQICTTKERTAVNAEETLVAGARWRLEEYWPTISRGNLAIVLALSDYDGMCRPLGFNAFVFANGAYVGTLSPVNLNSRTDGVLNQIPTFPSDGVIQAIFTRYAPTDPLCCPSLAPSVVTYNVVNGVIAPVGVQRAPKLALTPVPSPTRAPASTQPPVLPRSGEGLIPLLVLIAASVTLGAGVALRRRRRS
jgi:hypothetical protein